MKLKSLLPLALAGSLAFGGEVSRGIRNNNPGNLRKSSIQWKGATGNDGAFVKFASPEDGIRAMARVIRVYHDKYHINTISGIIRRWAPATENNTTEYIQFVSKKMGKKPNDPIAITNKHELSKLISAIIERENSTVPYDDATILRGIEKL